MKQNLPSIIISLLLAAGAWVFITLSGDFYLNTTIPIAYSNLPSNLAVDHSLPRYVNVKLKGSGWKFISRYFDPGNKFVVPISKDSTNSSINLMNLVADNAWLSSDFTVVDISPSFLRIKTEEVEYADKPVTLDVVMQFEEGFGLASKVKLTPEKVRLKGSKKLIEKIRAIKTQRIELGTLKEKVIVELNLESPEGVDIFPAKITAEIDVQKIADKEIEGVKLVVIENPGGKEVVLVPEEVTVVVRGGIDRIGALKPDEIKALLNYRELVSDSTGTALPNIVLPDNITFIDIKPPRIKYLVKQ